MKELFKYISTEYLVSLVYIICCLVLLNWCVFKIEKDDILQL